MREQLSIMFFIAACHATVNGPDAAPDPTPDANVPRECTAQRVVHLVGGTGGLAWFTLAWPLPDVITGFQTTYAYDDPTKATDLTTDPAHQLFARRIGSAAIWVGTGAHPEPSAFVAGTNETHTKTPTSTTVSQGSEIVAAGATLQGSLTPKFAVLVIGDATLYGTATGAPAPTVAATVDDAIALFDATTQAQLRPTAAQLARYVPTGAQPNEVSFATALAFTANAFDAGVLASVVMPAFDDDPHGAFDNGTAPARADHVAMALDAFYRDLATASESCGHDGQPVSVADNTVMIASGDTPKDSYSSLGWPDGTAQNSNILYVRSNGFTKPGWFGAITATVRTNFDPATGALDATATKAASTDAAWAGVLYAIARGDDTAVARFTTAPHAGVIGP